MAGIPTAPTPKSGRFAFGYSSSPPGSRSLCAAWSFIYRARSRRTHPGCGSQVSAAPFLPDALTHGHLLCTVNEEAGRTPALRNIDFSDTCDTAPTGLPSHNREFATQSEDLRAAHALAGRQISVEPALPRCFMNSPG